EGRRGDSGRQAIHHASGWFWMDLGTQRTKRWPAAGTLRAAGSAISKPDLSKSAQRSGGGQIRERGQSLFEVAGPALPLRALDLPADGTSHRGRNVAIPLAPG